MSSDDAHHITTFVYVRATNGNAFYARRLDELVALMTSGKVASVTITNSTLAKLVIDVDPEWSSGNAWCSSSCKSTVKAIVNRLEE